jgi:hypothetical protein
MRRLVGSNQRSPPEWGGVLRRSMDDQGVKKQQGTRGHRKFDTLFQIDGIRMRKETL